MTERRENELVRQIANQLHLADLRYDREPLVNGLRPDFVVYGPEGTRVVVEAKGWRSGGGNTARARDQVKHYAEVVGTPHALVVLWETKKNYWGWGVIGLDGLLPALQEIFGLESPGPRRLSDTLPPAVRTVFAAMPFDREYDDTFFVAMSHAAEQVDAAAVRVDKEEFTGDIVEEIKRLIDESVGVIVDLSESKPNVLYEAGYAHALGKPVVHICSTPMADLPFDVRNWNTLSYAKGQTARLRNPLATRLKAIP